MTETLVIVPITNGYADTSRVHLPAPTRRSGHQGNVITRFDSQRFPPRTWPSLCGQIPAGYIYAHAGLLEDAPVCGACQLAALPESA